MNSILAKIKNRFKVIQLKKKAQAGYRYVQKYPYRGFFAVLGLLFLLIFAGSFVGTKSNSSIKPTQKPIKVDTYHLGMTPHISLQAKIEKSGVVRIIAQSSGIVQSINVREGDNVQKGSNLIQLSSTYTGGNAQALQARLAEKQNQIVKETYDTQKDLIKKQREIAEKTNANTEELRKISDQSLNDTRSLIDLNQDILNAISNNLSALEAANTGSAADQQAILQLKQAKSQVQAGLNGLQAQARPLAYQVNTDNPPTVLSNLQKDITLRQLDVQEKSLDIGKEISALQLQLAYINENLMHPSSPFNGVVQAILVKEGQTVNPGTPLLILSSNATVSTAQVTIPRAIASTISTSEPSTIHIGSQSFEAVPYFVSSEAVEGQLYSAFYTIPDEFKSNTTDGEYIVVDIPVGYSKTANSAFYIPIDSVFQTQNSTYIYIIQNGKVKSKDITLGQVYGSYVEVVRGLSANDTIIVSRNIVEGDSVSAQ